MEGVEKGTDLIRIVNKERLKVAEEYKTNKEKHALLITKIDKLLDRFDSHRIEYNIDLIICRLRRGKRSESTYIRVIKDGRVIALCGENLPKPCVAEKEMNLKYRECGHEIDLNVSWGSSGGVILVDDDMSLCVHDVRLSGIVLMKVFSHTYRSFDGIISFISVRCVNGKTYIIDCIKLGSQVFLSEIFFCGVQKIFHCRKCAEIVNRNVDGGIGCYRCLELKSRDVFCDWRIRPINDEMVEIMCNNMNEMANTPMSIENSDECDATDCIEEYLEKYGISEEDRGLVSDLMDLRLFIAKSNDESVSYVMTDSQLKSIVQNRPKTKMSSPQPFPECPL
jgi:exosome complex exonuclease RRP6